MPEPTHGQRGNAVTVARTLLALVLLALCMLVLFVTGLLAQPAHATPGQPPEVQCRVEEDTP